MPANAKQELRDTSATDPAGPDSEDEIGARVICDRVDRKIQDKLQKQTGSLEKNSETTESNKETRDQIPEQTDPSGKTPETDTDDTKSKEDTPECSENDLESDNDDGETEEGQSEDSEQDEENAQPSSDQNPKESTRRQSYVQARDRQGEGWLLVAFSLGVIALLLILTFIFGFRAREFDFSQEDAIGTAIFHEKISYYSSPKFLR